MPNIKHPIRSSDDGKLHIKLSPGGMRFEKLSNGKYQQSVFILGGQSQRELTDASVAACLFDQCETASTVATLESLHWDEVIRALKAIQDENQSSTKARSRLDIPSERSDVTT